MQIDRITWRRYDVRDQRYVVVSLPRVKWLERDPDYVPPESMRPIDAETEIKIDRRKHNRIGNAARTGGAPTPSGARRRGAYRKIADTPAQLSEREKQALDLSLHGMRAPQIAGVMGCSKHAVWKLVKRARQKLEALAA